MHDQIKWAIKKITQDEPRRKIIEVLTELLEEVENDV
jgi:hypothetical protein